jgi:hypothetical protein
LNATDYINNGGILFAKMYRTDVEAVAVIEKYSHGSKRGEDTENSYFSSPFAGSCR